MTERKPSNFAEEFYWQMREAVAGKRMSRDQKRILDKKKKGKVIGCFAIRAAELALASRVVW